MTIRKKHYNKIYWNSLDDIPKEGIKICAKCKIEKEYSQFDRIRRKPSGYRSYCKTCRKVHDRMSSEDKKNSDLKRTYNDMDLKKYHHMLKEQKNCCAICKQPEPFGIRFTKLVVDHNHKTGKVRELLCSNCNRTLGILKENITTLENMILYIKKHNITTEE